MNYDVSWAGEHTKTQCTVVYYAIDIRRICRHILLLCHVSIWACLMSKCCLCRFCGLTSIGFILGNPCSGKCVTLYIRFSVADVSVLVRCSLTFSLGIIYDADFYRWFLLSLFVQIRTGYPTPRSCFWEPKPWHPTIRPCISIMVSELGLYLSPFILNQSCFRLFFLLHDRAIMSCHHEFFFTSWPCH